MEQHDVVVIGSGHNGLLVAAYMAKAGLDVLVLEKEERFGGGCLTAEVTLPGFKHDIMSTMHTIFGTRNPAIVHDELNLLSKYGLEYRYLDPALGILTTDGKFVSFGKDVDKTCAQIAEFSPRDAENYRRFVEFMTPLLDLIMFGLHSPPAPFYQFADFLGSDPVGAELQRMLTMSLYELACEWFEDPGLRAGMIQPCGELLLHPLMCGTALFMAVYVPNCAAQGLAFPVGGSGELPKALVRCIQDNGGEVRTGSPVAKICVSEGKATAAILKSGEEIGARRAIVSNLNIKQLFPGMLDGYANPEIERKIKRLPQSQYVGLKCDLALNEAPKWKASELASETPVIYVTHSNLEEQIDFYSGLLFGRTNAKAPLCICNTVYEPSRAPEGKHVLYLWHYEPCEPRINGKPADWDEIKEQVYEEEMETLRSLCTNMGSENILAHVCYSPKDIERMDSSMISGDYWHIGSHLGQLMSNRPIPEMATTRTPVDQLYICGASAYPLGAVTGGGRITALAMMEDLGVDFAKVISP